MVDISRPRQNGRHFQTPFSNIFSWKKIYKLRLSFHWSWFPRVQLTFQHWFKSWLGAGPMVAYLVDVYLRHSVSKNWAQDCSVLAMGLLQFGVKPSIYTLTDTHIWLAFCRILWWLSTDHFNPQPSRLLHCHYVDCCEKSEATLKRSGNWVRLIRHKII